MSFVLLPINKKRREKEKMLNKNIIAIAVFAMALFFSGSAYGQTPIAPGGRLYAEEEMILIDGVPVYRFTGVIRVLGTEQTFGTYVPYTLPPGQRLPRTSVANANASAPVQSIKSPRDVASGQASGKRNSTLQTPPVIAGKARPKTESIQTGQISNGFKRPTQ